MPLCNLHNKQRSEQCLEETEPGRWVCKSETKCKMPGDPKPGDWECPECKENNFASKEFCYRCSTPRPKGSSANPKKIYVGNLPPDGFVTDDLRIMFQKFGKIVDCVVMRGKDDQFGFVEFSKEEEAQSALAEKQEFGGKSLAIERARPVVRRGRVRSRSRSRSRDRHDRRSPPRRNLDNVPMMPDDWRCFKCSNLNFARRIQCHQCGSFRDDEPDRKRPRRHSRSPSRRRSTSRRDYSRERDREDRYYRERERDHPSSSSDLPRGWERRYDERSGRYYYVDHATRTTSWEHPRMLMRGGDRYR